MAAWITLNLLICVLLQANRLHAADEREHVHIKVRVPELLRKHTHHKHRTVHKPHHHHHQHHQHHPHPPHHPPLSYGRKARPALSPLPPPLSLSLPHNHLDTELYNDDEAMFNSFGAAMHLPPTLPTTDEFDDELATTNHDDSTIFDNDISSLSGKQQPPRHIHMPATTTIATATSKQQQQHLMQQMELMSALAAAAAGVDVANSGDSGDDDTETNTLLADGFLAELQRVYANGKNPLSPQLSKLLHARPAPATLPPLTTQFRATHKHKKQRHGPPASSSTTPLTFPLTTQQQQSMSLVLPPPPPPLSLPFPQPLRQQQQQYYSNYFQQQQQPPMAQQLFSNNNNYNNNLYATSASDEDDADEDAAAAAPTADGYHTNDASTYNTLNDYDESMELEQHGNGHDHTHSHRVRQTNTYGNTNNNNNNHYFPDANAGVNPVSYHQTAYGQQHAHQQQQPSFAPTHYTDWRQYQRHRPNGATQQQHQLPAVQQPSQLIATTQPINVVGPTATDFDDEHQQQQLQLLPQQQQQQQHHQLSLQQPPARYKKHKNRIKRKPNRNRNATQ